MEINILTNLRRNTYELLEKYVKDNNTGLAYIYVIMSDDTKSLLRDNDPELFYGVRIAIDDELDFGEIIIK